MSAYSRTVPEALGQRRAVVSRPAGRHRVGVLAGLLLAVGCAPQNSLELPELAGWEARREVLTSLDQWEFRGRIAVKAGDEGFNGNLTWWQHGDLFVASVSGPFGAGAVRIEGDEDLVRITDHEGGVTEMRDAERELQSRYGWTIPVDSLRYWALGVPDPAAPAETQFGDDGELRQIEQRNWIVRIDEYREGGGQPMPRRMLASNPDTRVRLVIDRWEFR